jgi:hypothetical protein
MSTQSVDRVRIEVVIGDISRIIELSAQGDEKVVLHLDEIPFPGTENADGVDRLSVHLAARGPVA